MLVAGNTNNEQAFTNMIRGQKGTIYLGAQFLFRSRDQGQSWDRISPDLTTNDPEKQRQEEQAATPA